MIPVPVLTSLSKPSKPWKTQLAPKRASAAPEAKSAPKKPSSEPPHARLRIRFREKQPRPFPVRNHSRGLNGLCSVNRNTVHVQISCDLPRGAPAFSEGEGTSGKRRHRNNLPRRIVFRNPNRRLRTLKWRGARSKAHRQWRVTWRRGPMRAADGSSNESRTMQFTEAFNSRCNPCGQQAPLHPHSYCV